MGKVRKVFNIVQKYCLSSTKKGVISILALLGLVALQLSIELPLWLYVILFPINIIACSIAVFMSILMFEKQKPFKRLFFLLVVVPLVFGYAIVDYSIIIQVKNKLSYSKNSKEVRLKCEEKNKKSHKNSQVNCDKAVLLEEILILNVRNIELKNNVKFTGQELGKYRLSILQNIMLKNLDTISKSFAEKGLDSEGIRMMMLFKVLEEQDKLINSHRDQKLKEVQEIMKK